MLHSLRELEAEIKQKITDIQDVTVKLKDQKGSDLVREHCFGQWSAYEDILKSVRKIIKEGQ